MSAENQAAAPAPDAARMAKKGRSSAPALLAFVVLAILVGAASAWFIMQQRNQTQAAAISGASSPPKYLLHLDGFTVNLADPEEAHFLRVTMDLGVDRLPAGSSEEKSTAAVPVGRVRDAILSVLTVCKADPLLTSEGKSKLKRDLVEALQRQAPELGVREVYFTEFLVQR